MPKSRSADRKDTGQASNRSSETGAQEKGSPLRWAWIALFVVVTLATYWQNTRYGLIGFDTYPIIISSRIQSMGDFAGTFTEKLMDERYSGEFYRPVVNLVFAVGYAFSALDPLGYQVLNLLIMIGCALAFYALVRRLTIKTAPLASVTATLIFILHPLQFEVVPVPPRCAEMLSFLFMALSLVTLLSPRTMALRRPPLLPAVFALLAYLSKEIGLILPVLGFAVVFMYSPRKGMTKRLVHGLIASSGLVVALVLIVIIRACILGGIGGHEEESLVKTALASLWIMNRLLLLPQQAMFGSTAASVLLACVALCLALTFVFHIKHRRKNDPSPDTKRCLLQAAALGVLMTELVLLVYGADRRIEPWYYFIPVAGYALCFGAIVQAAVADARTGPSMHRLLGALPALLVLGVLLAWQLSYSPLIYRYDEYEQATTKSDRFLTDLTGIIEKADDGTVVLAPPMPMYVHAKQDRPTIHGSRALDVYSVQAWVELAFPHRKIDVKPGQPGSDKPGKDELFVHITQALE